MQTGSENTSTPFPLQACLRMLAINIFGLYCTTTWLSRRISFALPQARGLAVSSHTSLISHPLFIPFTAAQTLRSRMY
jgi:hypothetical protein